MTKGKKERTFKVVTETGFANCIHEETVTVAIDATEEEIEEACKDVAFNHISWAYEEI